MTVNAKRETLTIKETAQILGIGLNQAYAACKNGEIHCIEIGHRKLVPKKWLHRMLDRKLVTEALPEGS